MILIFMRELENKIITEEIQALLLPSEREGYYLINKDSLDILINDQEDIKVNLVTEGMSSLEKKAYRKGYKKGYSSAYKAILRFIKLYSMASSAKLK